MSLLRRKNNPPVEPQVYPVGTCVKTEMGYFYISKPSYRLRIISTRVLSSWNFHRIAESTEKAVSNYKIMGKLGFRNGSLIYNIADGKLYLISENKRHQITNPDVLNLIGAKLNEIVTVSDEEMKLHSIGDELT